MKKKISLLLCVLLTALCFAGCSSKEATTVDTSVHEQVANTILASFSQMGEEDFAQFEEVSEYQLEYTMMTAGLPIEGENFLAMIRSWQAAEKECGSLIQYGELEVEVDGDEVTITSKAQYEQREATIMFCFDEDSNLESMDVSAKYSTGEILEKAGLNTLLGMGTVVAVLIFLAFLISLMKYIPVIMDKLQGKPQKEEAKAEVVTAPVVVEEDYTDDLELVAVITAAIAAQEGTSTDGFVVRSIRRRSSNKWN